MSYRNPQEVIDNRIGIVSQGVAQLLGETTKRLDTYTAQKQKEKALYKKTMDKAASRAASRASGDFKKAQTASNKFTGGLYGESGAPTEEAVKFDEQINGIFTNWGTELNDQISEIQKAGGSEMEIAAATDKYIGKLNQFTTDMANWEAAREEFMIAKQAAQKGGMGSVGTLLGDPELQRNPELINMFTAMTDDELDNLYITIDPNGSTRISMGTITDGNFDAQSTSDISAWARSHKDNPDGKYFMTNESFSEDDYKDVAKTFDALKDNKNLQKNGKLDKGLVKDYLFNNDMGRTLVTPYLEDGSKNKWNSLTGDSSAPYSDDAYLNLIIDNTWDNLYAPSQKQSSSPSSSSSSTTPNKKRAALVTTVKKKTGVKVKRKYLDKYLKMNPNAVEGKDYYIED